MTGKAYRFLLLLAVAVAGHVIAYKIIHVPPQMELVVIAGIALFYPIMRYPMVGLYALFIVAPFIPFLRRIYYLAYARPKVDPLIMLPEIILALMVMGLFFEFREEMRRDRRSSPYRRMAIIYFCYMLLRSVVLNHQPVSEGLADFKFYGPAVILFLVGCVFGESTAHLKRLWFITIVVAVLAAVHGFRQLFVGYMYAEQLWINSIDFTSLFIGGIARPFSFFQAPVAFADYLLLGVVGVLMASFWSKQWVWILVTIPIFFYGTLITSVRSSWIGVVITIVLWFGVGRLRGGRNRIAAMVVLAIGYLAFEVLKEATGSGLGVNSFFRLISAVVPNQQYMDMLVTDRASAIYNPLEEHSFLSRLALWRFILRSSANPIMAIAGRGVGTLKADSIYMTYLAEFGYPGLIFIVTLFVVFVRAGLRLMDSSDDPFTVGLARGMVTFNIVIAVVSITGSHIHYFPGDYYFWFWNGVVVKLLGVNQDSANST